MISKNQLPQNSYLVSKDQFIPKATDFIDHTLNRLTEVQLSSAGTAVQKAILIAEKCVALGIAQYSRFTTQMVPHEGREVLYTIIKMKRPSNNNNKAQKGQKKQQKQPVSSNPQKRQQYGNRKHSEDQYQPERNRKQVYNQEHRQRNERREQQQYREGNNARGQKNNQRNYNEPNRRDKDYR